MAKVFQILLVLGLISCGGGSLQKNRKGPNLDTTSTRPSPTDPSFPPDDPPIFWYNDIKVFGTLNVNANINTPIYIKGKAVHNYLKNMPSPTRTYCLGLFFEDDTLKKELWFRTVALSLSEENVQVHIFRVDLSSEKESREACQQSSTSPSSKVGYTPKSLCTHCHGVRTTSHLALYHDDKIIPPHLLNFNGLHFRIDMSDQTTDPTPTTRDMAMSETQEDHLSRGREGKQWTLKEYHCLTSSEGELADYQRGTCTSIAYDTPVLCRRNGEQWNYYCQVGTCSIPNYHSKKYCQDSGGTWTEIFPGTKGENGTEDAYMALKREVWRSCGCEDNETVFGENECRSFGLKLNDEEKVVCKLPPSREDERPKQELSIFLSSRHSPHRLFRQSDGKSFATIEELKESEKNALPEGDNFYYLDEIHQQVPRETSFSMTSILGPYSLQLNKALPAKVIPVKNREYYLIRATSGNYTPCPDCAKDSWNRSLSPWPMSRQGNGLKGWHSSNRADSSKNITQGNYEDTIFGRACYLPPTMIPFSHKGMNEPQKQRLARLKTQGALYINGYQKDWFGFNLGALIGSFDGVSWFAVGTGRRVLATSNKLFLAINAPFADLADNSPITVDINLDIGGPDVIPDSDFDPSLSLNHPQQNQAATCRHWHQCATDSDCVSKLGWEFVCADIGSYRTKWPRFNAKSEEKTFNPLENEQQKFTYAKLLTGPLPPGSKKRCVYRGSGAICKGDVDNALEAKKKKLFRCAPNFYCAKLKSSAFNQELVRTPNMLDSFLYGKDANVLGRPLDYIDTTSGLDRDIIANLENNFALHTDELEDVGICRPGKNLDPISLLEQHRGRDRGKRTDYINQISSCDSSTQGDERVATCPIFQTVEGEDIPKGDYIRDTFDLVMAHKQNQCGGEARWNKGTTTNPIIEDSFGQIELGPLHSLQDIFRPSLVSSACSRRAGSVCHTDLDCSPNRLHYSEVELLGKRPLGDTTAEKLYWSEYLICSQGDPVPYLHSKDFFDFNITKNKCCRPVGEELTMFTQDDDDIIPDNYPKDSGLLNTLYYPYNFTTIYPRGYYSRYIVAQAENRGGLQSSPYPEVPRVNLDQIPKSFQWKTLSDTGEKTCCGGGFIRQFADESNDWSKGNRIHIDPEEFTCLNYQNELYFTPPQEIPTPSLQYNRFAHNLCLAPGDKGCIQTAFVEPTGFNIAPPREISQTTATLNTSPQDEEGGLIQIKSSAVPYMPLPFANQTPIDSDDKNAPYNYLASPTDYWGVSFYLPLYIGGVQNINSISMEYYNDKNQRISTVPLADAGAAACNSAMNSNPIVVADITFPRNSYCITVDTQSSGSYLVLHAKGVPSFTDPPAWKYGGISINFNVIGTSAYCYDPPCSNDPLSRGMVAGNDLYYLTKLGRLELLGIPQIWYEPIYCNSDRSKLVGGIFSSLVQDRPSFELNSFAYDPVVNGRSLTSLYGASATDISNSAQMVTMQDRISLDTIFSGHKFKCCRHLGERVKHAKLCCSGYGLKVESEDEEEDDDEVSFICKLPPGTNLSVYFNRFVGNDGTTTWFCSLPQYRTAKTCEARGGLWAEDAERGLKEEDFIAETGEPKNEKVVYKKLHSLGEEHCASGEVRRGGAFGYFLAEPFDGVYTQVNNNDEDSSYYSIVDSPEDSDPTNDAGYNEFKEGFRWNHHVYCR